MHQRITRPWFFFITVADETTTAATIGIKFATAVASHAASITVTAINTSTSSAAVSKNTDAPAEPAVTVKENIVSWRKGNHQLEKKV